MKTSKLILASLLAACSFMVSCSDDDNEAVIVNEEGGGIPGFTLPEGAVAVGGILTKDLTLTSGTEYFLTEQLLVPDNITLTIEAGVTVQALVGNDVFIAIEQGGTINANGTATAPIVLTSFRGGAARAGDWGGLILLGRAPINSIADLANQTATSEIGNLPYGGNVSNDNSGTLRYVRVEYSGGSASGASENNGFSFYGVGSGTTVEFIEAFEGADDGVEFFGGTVNASNVAVVNCQDDSVDWTEGYTGTLTDVYIRQGSVHDKGIEADGFNTDIGNNSNPVFFSNPTVTNITINGTGDDQGVNLRASTRATINNIIINDFAEGFDIGENSDDPTGTSVVDDITNVNGVVFENVTTMVENNTSATFTDADLLSDVGTASGTDFATWGAGWTVTE